MKNLPEVKFGPGASIYPVIIVLLSMILYKICIFFVPKCSRNVSDRYTGQNIRGTEVATRDHEPQLMTPEVTGRYEVQPLIGPDLTIHIVHFVLFFYFAIISQH